MACSSQGQSIQWVSKLSRKDAKRKSSQKYWLVETGLVLDLHQ